LRNPDRLACLLMLIAVHERRNLLPRHVQPSLMARVANNAYAHRCADTIAPLCSPWIDMCLTIQVTIETMQGTRCLDYDRLGLPPLGLLCARYGDMDCTRHRHCHSIPPRHAGDYL
jgi:hypothetical protein